MSERESHDEFLALCAVATSGSLSEEEQSRLRRHLAICPSCREAMREYKQVVETGVLLFAPEDFPAGLRPDPSWSEKDAEAALLERLKRRAEKQEEQKKLEQPKTGNESYRNPNGDGWQRRSSSLYAQAGEAVWRHLWLQYAAGILVIAALGLSLYRIGVRRGGQIAFSSAIPGQQRLEELARELADISHEREIARADAERREEAITELNHQISLQAQNIVRLKNTETNLEIHLRAGSLEQERLIQERTGLARELELAEGNRENAEQKLHALTSQGSAESARTKDLESEVAELTRALRDRSQEAERQQELLAHDRDIRELIGARDLYVAEVYDVAGNGATKKPFGRVFYTKGKSLVFYAYDLDQQNGRKSASTFQAWGRRGPGRQEALSLGMFYQDNAAKKRWILRSNDPKTLAQIDAVFVTVEPDGGSQKPSGKQLLFAYLRIDPNHP